MKTVFLHVGKHKTGTTSIQRFLSYNRNELIRAGLFPVDNNQIRNFLGVGHFLENDMNNVTISHLILRDDLLTPMRYIGGNPFLNLDRALLAHEVNSFIRQIQAPRVIISAESFSFLRHPNEKHLYNIAFDSLHVIPLICLREHSGWMKSWKIQTKNINRPHSVDVVGSIFDYSQHSWLLDDDAIIKFFESPDVFSYEDAIAKHGSTVIEFSNRLGIDLSKLKKKDFFENVSFN